MLYLFKPLYVHPNNSDTENNDLEDNEDNYHQLFSASDDEEVDFYGFSDEEEIGCPDECPDDKARKRKKKVMNTLMAGIWTNGSMLMNFLSI